MLSDGIYELNLKYVNFWRKVKQLIVIIFIIKYINFLPIKQLKIKGYSKHRT